MSSLVYLDLSTIVTLERSYKRDPKRFSEFVARWQEAECVLALSFVHLLEISGSAHADSRNARVRVLHALEPTRMDLIPSAGAPRALQQLAGREVFAVLGRIAGQESRLESMDRHWTAFPTSVPDGATGALLRTLTSRDHRRIYAEFRKASETEASARSRSTDSKHLQTRLRDLPSGSFDAEDAASARAWLQAFLESDQWKADLATTIAPESREEAERFVRDWIEQTFEEMLTAGAREVFARRVEADFPGALKRRTDELISRHVFRQIVEDTVVSVLKVTDPPTVMKLVDSVLLEDCPGTWLRFAVERELRAARTKWEPGATYDLLHLSHLPYVDVMFTDREIADNTRKVRQRSGVPPAVAQAPAPISVAASLDEVERVIRSLPRTPDGREFEPE